MSVDLLYSSIQYIATIQNRVQSLGINLEVVSDFEELLDITRTSSEIPPLYPMFDPSASFVSPENGFWIKGTNANGEIVHTQALRLLDLGAGSLADHMRLHRLKYIVQGDTTEPDHGLLSASPAANKITGSVAYHGQIWLRGGPNGCRGMGLSALLPRFAMALCLMEWPVEYVFGFMDPRLACKGLQAQYGYAHIEPENWLTPDGANAREYWLAWTAREDIAHLMRLCPIVLHETLTLQERAKLVAAEPAPRYQAV